MRKTRPTHSVDLQVRNYLQASGGGCTAQTLQQDQDPPAKQTNKQTHKQNKTTLVELTYFSGGGVQKTTGLVTKYLWMNPNFFTKT